MKKIKKIAIGIGLAILMIVLTGLFYVSFFLPDVGPAPDMKVSITPERVERGKYLANHVTLCVDCHSKRDWTRFSGPVMEGTLGIGGELFDQQLGFPGKYHAANITPAGIGNYTDGELFRAITTGVAKDGRALFPVMPYRYYGRMDSEDIRSIIAYIRTLEPVNNKVPKSVSDFPMNFIINTIPQKAQPVKIPTPSDTISYGSYMTNAAGCMECHTKDDKGVLIKGMEFAGGRAFASYDGSVVRSSNITPDNATGIGSWTADMFVGFFRLRSDSLLTQSILKKGEFNTVMPWTMYGKMKEQDLRAIYAYLRTMKPISNTVTRFTSSGKE